MATTSQVETDVATSYRVPLLVLAAIAGAQTMDPAIANIALVDATSALRIPAGAVSLAATISTLAAAATVIAFGNLADRLGRRRVLVAALALAIAGDLVAALSIDPTTYLAGRFVAGAGLGAAFSAAFAYVRTVAGDGRLGAALGAWTAQLTVFAILGQVLGGSLTERVGWRAAMCIVPALCLVSLLGVRRTLPIVPTAERTRVDWLGHALLMAGVVGVLYGVSRFAISFSAPGTLVPLVGGLLALAAFAVVELRSDHAVFPIRLFRNPVFVAAVLVGALWNLLNGTAVLQFSNLWQYVMKDGTGFVALGQLPLAAAMIVAAMLVGRKLSSGTRVRTFFVLGVVCSVLGLLSTVVLHVDSSYPIFLPALVLVGLGIGCFNTPSASLFVSQSPPESYGVVTSSRLMVGQFGYSLATAMSSVLVNDLTQGGVVRRLTDAGVPPSDIGTAWTGVADYFRMDTELPSTAAARDALHAAGPSYVHAFIIAMVVLGAVTVVVGLGAAWLVRDLPGSRAPGSRAPGGSVPDQPGSSPPRPVRPRAVRAPTEASVP